MHSKSLQEDQTTPQDEHFMSVEMSCTKFGTQGNVSAGHRQLRAGERGAPRRRDGQRGRGDQAAAHPAAPWGAFWPEARHEAPHRSVRARPPGPCSIPGGGMEVSSHAAGRGRERRPGQGQAEVWPGGGLAGSEEEEPHRGDQRLAGKHPFNPPFPPPSPPLFGFVHAFI